MAMGRRGRDAAERAIACSRPFTNSTGSLTGSRGSTRDLGHLSSHRDRDRIKELLGRATYVVWSYATPIGFEVENGEGTITRYYVDEPHSATTSNHQAILRVSWGEFEVIGEGPWTRAVQPRARRASRERRHAQLPRPAFETVRDEVRQGLASWRAEAARLDPVQDAEDGGYALGGPMDGYPDRAAYLLDPRLSDPNWTPFGEGRNNLPPGADNRDFLRVQAEQEEKGPWTP
jgi:hypothetical protein